MRRITILLAALAALMLVPAAQAFAASLVTVDVNGNGSGEISSTEGVYVEEDEEYEYFGIPPLECSYASPGPVTGNCESEMEEAEEHPGLEGIGLKVISAEGSEIVSWESTGSALSNGCVNTAFSPEDGKRNAPTNCKVLNLSFNPQNISLTATVCLEGTAVYEDIGEGHKEFVECGAEEGPSGPPLTLNIEEGSGTVVSNPAGIECTGAAPKACTTEEIAEGETVTLTASPAPGYRFKSWKGCDKKSGEFGVNGRQCTISLTAARSVSAKFVKTYDVTLENGGNGKISTKPGGALCLPNCSETSAQFDEGKTVEVLAKANKHFHLASWGGDCSGSGSCSVVASADHTVSATFAEDAKYALSIVKEGGGQALIKTKGPGTVCSYTCGSSTASFYTGEEVLVSWKLGKGTSSLTWTSGAGTCTGKSEAAVSTCTVTMSSAKSLVAKFE